MRPLPALILALCATSLMADEASVLRSSLGKLQKNDPAAAQDVIPGSTPFHIVMKRVDPGTSPWRTKLIAADWLLRGHLLRQRLEIKDEVAPSLFLDRGWQMINGALLGISNIAPEAGETRGMFGHLVGDTSYSLDKEANLAGKDVPKEVMYNIKWLLVEIAARRLNPSDMRDALAEYKSRFNEKDPRSQTFAYICAVHAGDWAFAQEAYRGLENQGTVHKALRDPGLFNPSGFDHAPLMDLLKERNPKASGGKLETQVYKVQQWRQRPKGAADWVATGPLPEPLEIRGAAAFCYQHPAAFTGYRDGKGVTLRAWVDGAPQRLVEDLQLTPDPARPGTWTGTLLKRQGTAVESLEVEADLLTTP